MQPQADNRHRRKSWWRYASKVIAVTAVAMIVSCSPSGNATAPPSTIPAATTPAPTTPGPTSAASFPADIDIAAFMNAPFQKELENVDANGDRTVESALRLFAIAFGPLPGVDAPTDNTGARSGTLALDEVRRHDAELTPEQRSAIDAYLAPDADSVQITIPEVGSADVPNSGAIALVGPMSVAADAATTAAVKQVGNQMRAAIVANLGFNVTGPLDLLLKRRNKDGDFGVEQPFFSPSGTYSGCKIVVFEKATGGLYETLANTLAHEIFHCFEDFMGKSLANALASKKWLSEGAAEWVAVVIAGPDSTTPVRYATYLVTPGKSLFLRQNDAIGFYGHLAEVGFDPWTHFPQMFANTENSAAFAAAGATEERFLITWASSYFRSQVLGRDWHMEGPGVPPLLENTDLTSLSVVNGDSKSFSANDHSNSVYTLGVHADIVTFQTTGTARLHDGSTDVVDLAAATFCATSDGCICPDGELLNFAKLGPQSSLAVTGGVTATSGRVSGMSLQDFCDNRHKAVAVHFDRPGYRYNDCEAAAAAGNPCSPADFDISTTTTGHPGPTLDLISCDGPFGTWRGTMTEGGLTQVSDSSGATVFEIAFSDFPIEFTVGNGGSTRTASGSTNGFLNITVASPGAPTGPAAATYTFTVTVSATSMTLIATDGFSFSNPLSDQFPNMAVVPAPAGSCP